MPYPRILRTAILALVMALLASPSNGQELMTFESWKSQCLKAPANRVLQGRMPTNEQLPLKDFPVVTSTAEQLLEQFQESTLADESKWIGKSPKDDGFFDIKRSYFQPPRLPFQPFTQKVRIPAGSQVIFHGDLHGDIRSLVSTLGWLNENGFMQGFKLKKNKYWVFLGDYVDRGSYGVEVLYTLMRLKLANQDQVLMARGNHEDFKMTATYGFLREGQMKYGRKFNPLPLWRIYDFLPVAIYLGVGNDYLQCNHGGMEPGYDPKSLLAADGDVRYQLLGEVKQKTFAADHPEWLRESSKATLAMTDQKLANFTPTSPITPSPIGFMWNDFFVFEDDPIIGFNAARLAFNHGQASAAYLMGAASSDSAQLRAVFRAHQHSAVPNPAMNRIVASNGAFRHWQRKDSRKQANVEKPALRSLIEQADVRRVPEGSVWTFNVSPDSLYGAGNDYAFDTIGILETAEAFDDWRLKVVNVPVAVD